MGSNERDAKMDIFTRSASRRVGQARESKQAIDWRRIQFNLSTEDGQRGYQEYIQQRYQASDVLSWLDQHCRAQVIDESHYWIAEAIMRKTFALSEPGPWKRGDRADRPGCPPTLFI